MSESDPKAAGLLGSIRRMLDTVLEMLQTRIELFAVELREERVRFLQLLLWAAAVLFSGMMTVLLFTATILLLFEGRARIYAAAAFTVVYLSGALGLFWRLRQRLKNGPQPFAETLSQLKKDRECLKSLK